MSGLSAEDKAALEGAYCRHSEQGKRQVGHYGCQNVAALMAAAVEQIVAERVAAAEQRGREDNEDHNLCYVHGSRALAAYVAEHVTRALNEATDAIRERAADWEAEFRATDNDADYGRWDGWANALDLVRNLAAKPT